MSTEVEVNISELTLTPLTEAFLVNEILKGLVYQKCQVPYPFNWLKTVVEKRRKKIESAEELPKKLNYTYENHFRLVSTTYDTLDSIMKGISKEFCDSNNIRIQEIVVLFGTTPNSPKEVFTISIPTSDKGHSERNHISQLNKQIQKVLRNIFLSQTWMDSIDATISCTNTFIYLKKEVVVDTNISNDVFEMCEPLHISSNIKQSKLILSYNSNSSKQVNCCKSLVIFNDNGDHTEKVTEAQILNSKENIVWCRSKSFLKGFKDRFINKVSVCDLW